jgi:acyl-coenzyme A thioesterase PaaI-like protein
MSSVSIRGYKGGPMTTPNQLARTVARFDALPAALRPAALSLALGHAVPFTGTARLKFELVTPEKVVVSIKNRRRVRNHIRGLHAAAMALLAETATGFCVGLNLPDDRLPLIKSLKVEYLKRAQGDMRAVATLRPEQVEAIRTLEKGEVTVPVTVTDSSDSEPIRAEMVWAWVPRQRT